MCHWLTVAAADRTVLAPLREFGAALEPVEFPALPPAYQHLQRYLVTGNGCSCSLMRRENHEALAAALTTARLVGGVLLVHHTFGDEPRGQRRLGPTEPRDAATFLAGGDEVDDRWIVLTARWRPEAPLPRTLDGGRVVAVAVHGSDDEPRALFALVEHPYVPGCTWLQCDVEWNVVAQEWHADAASARTAAAAMAGSTLRWRDVGPSSMPLV
jgi:hypothetical protein